MWLLREERNVLLLSVCQALFWSALMIGITMSGLVGQMLAEHKAFATLPAGILALVTVLVTRPASLLMQRFGRRAGFLLGALAGLIGGLICAGGIFAGNFMVFCLGNGVLGLYQAIGQYYRLAATDSVAPERRGRAVSTVMAGGIVAALVAPSLSVWSKDLFFPALFAGSFLLVSVLSIVAVAFIVVLTEPQPMSGEENAAGRPFSEIIRQPIFIFAIVNAGIAHGTMILVMLATPLAMVACSYPVAAAASVIQWHVLGMFVPSFFSGQLIDRWGAATVGMIGATILCLSVIVAASGIELTNFGIALALLGIGWNLMYVAGTTMIAAAHRPAERGRVQGAAEMMIAGIATLAAFASGGLLNGLGWTAVNMGATPLLIAAAGLTFWFARRTSARNAQSST
ncbi:MAG: MFS transporter [Candidatus Competibacteraceae bacterium]|jgi:MFS family permease|nr:MFS transporter [Candidatus Competibacteraceae bacterium]